MESACVDRGADGGGGGGVGEIEVEIEVEIEIEIEMVMLMGKGTCAWLLVPLIDNGMEVQTVMRMAALMATGALIVMGKASLEVPTAGADHDWDGGADQAWTSLTGCNVRWCRPRLEATERRH